MKHGLKHGLPTQIKHCGGPLADLAAARGELDTLLPGRQVYLQKQMYLQKLVYLQKNAGRGYIVDQRTSMMVPASFAPIRR